jgi:hypothetical protein
VNKSVGTTSELVVDELVVSIVGGISYCAVDVSESFAFVEVALSSSVVIVVRIEL